MADRNVAVVAGLVAGAGALWYLLNGLNAGPGSGGSGGSDELGPIAATPGEIIGQPFAVGLDELANNNVAIQIIMGTAFVVPNPQVVYQGPGRDTFAYLRVGQNQNGRWVTVYGSGVAGLHIPQASSQQVFSLVRADQPQPSGVNIKQALAAFPFPGTGPTPICGGAPAQPGPATIVLEIYQRKDPQDADGYSAPLCGSAALQVPRIPVARHIYWNKALFVAHG